MVKANTAVAWALVRDEDGQVCQFMANSVVVFRSEREARKFAKRAIGRTKLRGMYTPRPVVGRLAAWVQGRPLAVRSENGRGTADYVVMMNASLDNVFDLADEMLAA